MPYSPTTWVDSPSTATPINAANLQKIESGIQYSNQVFNVRDTQYAGGAKGDGVTDDTAAIQAAIDAAGAVNGTVYVPPSPEATPYMFSNLQLWAKMSLVGGGINIQTVLKRIAGSTGDAIHEYSSSGVNPSGATAIVIRDISVYGNGTTGDGIVLGFNGPMSLNYKASLQDVEVRDFTSGAGFKLNSNACFHKHLWANVNNVGFDLQGGGNTFVGLWSQANSSYQFYVKSSGDSFAGLYSEGGPTVATSAVPFMRVEGNQNRIHGYQVSNFFGNRSNLIHLATGTARNCFYGVFCDAGSYTFTNGIYYEVMGFGTGTDTLISEFLDQGNQSSWHYNGTTNGRTETRGGTIKIGGQYNAATAILAHISASTTWDPASIATGAMTSTTIALSQVSLGDVVVPSFSLALPAGMILSAAVTAAGTVTVTLYNITGSTQNIASGTLRVDGWLH